MERTPDTPHTLRLTPHHRSARPSTPLQLLPTRAAQVIRFLQNLMRRHIPHADGLLAAVDVCPADDGMFARARGDGKFDGGVGGGEAGEVGVDEGAGRVLVGLGGLDG